MATSRLCKCGCGISLDGLDRRRQYANDTHRKRVSRGQGAGGKGEGPTPSTVWRDAAKEALSRLTDVPLLDRVEIEQTAARLDELPATSAGFAQLVKHLKASMADLERRQPRVGDPAELAKQALAEKRLKLVG